MTANNFLYKSVAEKKELFFPPDHPKKPQQTQREEWGSPENLEVGKKWQERQNQNFRQREEDIPYNRPRAQKTDTHWRSNHTHPSPGCAKQEETQENHRYNDFAPSRSVSLPASLTAGRERLNQNYSYGDDYGRDNYGRDNYYSTERPYRVSGITRGEYLERLRIESDDFSRYKSAALIGAVGFSSALFVFSWFLNLWLDG